MIYSFIDFLFYAHLVFDFASKIVFGIEHLDDGLFVGVEEILQFLF